MPHAETKRREEARPLGREGQHDLGLAGEGRERAVGDGNQSRAAPRGVLGHDDALPRIGPEAHDADEIAFLDGAQFGLETAAHARQKHHVRSEQPIDISEGVCGTEAGAETGDEDIVGTFERLGSGGEDANCRSASGRFERLQMAAMDLARIDAREALRAV